AADQARRGDASLLGPPRRLARPRSARSALQLFSALAVVAAALLDPSQTVVAIAGLVRVVLIEARAAFGLAEIAPILPAESARGFGRLIFGAALFHGEGVHWLRRTHKQRAGERPSIRRKSQFD